jgi:hypothetical protein
MRALGCEATRERRLLYLLNATGAIYFQPGAAPKALILYLINVESRLQRWRLFSYKSWGVAPGLILTAGPLALNTSRSFFGSP